MIKIALSRLGNDQLYTFGSRLKNLLAKINAEAMGILFFVTLFLEKFGIFEQSYEQESAEEKRVADKDALRDNYFLALRAHIENFLRHKKSKEKRDIAVKLLRILNKDGKNIYRRRNSVETASLQSSIRKIEDKHLADLELLFATEWYEMLKEAQADFETTLSEVNEAAADRKRIASASATRIDVELAIRKLFMSIEVHQEEKPSTELADLIGKIQEECDRF